MTLHMFRFSQNDAGTFQDLIEIQNKVLTLTFSGTKIHLIKVTQNTMNVYTDSMPKS